MLNYTPVDAMKLDIESAARVLGQLGNPTRLRVVRLLVVAGEKGMTVGEIQQELEVPLSTMSHHLSHLVRVGLIEQARNQTRIQCRVAYDQVEAVAQFLTSECCKGVKLTRSRARGA
jgi:ArsR family transcriptional regulator